MPRQLLWTSNTDTGFVNNAPQVVGGVYTTSSNNPSTVTPTVTDPDFGDTYSLTIVTPPKYGTAQVLANRIVYTPSSGFFGVDALEIEARDSSNKTGRGYLTYVVTTAALSPVTTSQGVYTNRIDVSTDQTLGEFAPTGGEKLYKVMAKDTDEADYSLISGAIPSASYSDSRAAVQDNSVGRKMSYTVEKIVRIAGQDYTVSKTAVGNGYVNNAPSAPNAQGHAHMRCEQQRSRRLH